MNSIKFLVLRFSSIGDIVLTTPIIRGLKQQVENAEVHFFTKPAFKEILEANPYIDKLHVLEDNLKDQLEILKQERFDYIIDLHKNIRTARVKSALKIVSFSFDKLNFQKWLLVNFKIDKLPRKHLVDRYYDSVSVFDVHDDGKGLDYFIPEKDYVDVSSLMPELKGNDYIGFVMGANHNTKMLTEEKINSILAEIKHPVILLGGKDDYPFGKRIQEQHPERVFNACGQFSINQSASLVQQSRVMITPDTGLMHVAAAFKKPLISIWGNTVPEFGMYPYYSNSLSSIFEVKGLSCRPCSKLGYRKCPKKHFRCMNDIDYKDIVEKACYFFNSL
ncbi:MAG: glycosyltransferase family 9 protein [Bacteroidota bacterium]